MSERTPEASDQEPIILDFQELHHPGDIELEIGEIPDSDPVVDLGMFVHPDDYNPPFYD